MTFGTNVAVAALAVLALSVGGCEKPAKAGLAKDDGPGKPVAEAEFKAAGKTWPLKVAEARVGCDPPGALFVLSDGKKYALNDWASGAGDYDDLSEIRIEAKKGGKEKPTASYVPADDLVASARTACRW